MSHEGDRVQPHNSPGDLQGLIASKLPRDCSACCRLHVYLPGVRANLIHMCCIEDSRLPLARSILLQSNAAHIISGWASCHFRGAHVPTARRDWLLGNGVESLGLPLADITTPIRDRASGNCPYFDILALANAAEDFQVPGN